MQETFEKEKAKLIQDFENPEEEPEQPEVIPTENSVEEIVEETEVD